MKRKRLSLFAFVIALAFVILGSSAGSGELFLKPDAGAAYASAASAAPQAVKVNAAVPPFSVTVNHVRVNQRNMVSYPLYSVKTRDNAGKEVTYIGYLLSDVFDALGVSGSFSTVAVTEAGGKSIQVTAKLAGESTTLLALRKDGVQFEKSPWFAPCGSGTAEEYVANIVSIEAVGAKLALPLPAPDPDDVFGVDLNINMETIDYWLGRDDVVYRDLRMLFDPAVFEDIGGIADLTQTIEGFTIVPYPYIATISPLPVPGGYNGKTLFTVTWHEDGSIATVKANYLESMVILEELFPVDKPIFLMCGGAGYSSEMRAMLRFLGWNQNLLYVVGPNWTYQGAHSIELVMDSGDPEVGLVYTTWRAVYATIDFTRLHPGTRSVQRAELKPIDPKEPHCILDILAAKKAAEAEAGSSK
ncbi:MAG: hypothetical protein FWH49_04825 [Clostridiales bacterium]|nr:hypothetical protein [Clostridiales bacterium]